jgi:cell division protease FtsH
VRLGGRAAELIVFGEGSTGASNDLAGATSLATRMVVEFGLSDALGPVGYASDAPEYLGTSPDGARGHPYSEETQRLVDTEVARLLREAEARAVELLRAHRGELDRLAELLMAEETVDGSVVEATVRGVVLRKPQVLADAGTHAGTQPVTHAKSRKDAALLPEPATSTETEISGR